MNNKMMRKVLASALVVSTAAATLLTGCGSSDSSSSAATLSEEDQAIANDPYGKYAETVTYTTGYVLTSQGEDTLRNSDYANDTTTDNAYTRYIKSVINVQNENAFEAVAGDDYDQKVSLAIASQDIPDIMYISDYQTLSDLVESDMIEDLTDVYNTVACDTVKSSYESYGDNNPINTCTFDGKIMAFPKTQLSDGQDFLWIRKDWLDALGLEEPSSIEDMENVMKAFIEQDPDGNGTDDTIGLAVLADVYGGYPNNHFAIDNVFTSFGAYPNVWITDEDGKATYGSVQPEMKDALSKLNEWYNSGLIDKEFATRTSDDIVALISNNQCGMYIGPWWSPFNVCQTTTYENSDAEWINVSCPVGSDGKIQGINTKSYGGFVVVRKGYEHPEIAMKIINIASEYSQQDKTDAANEIKENQSIAYFNWPLYCQVQPGNNAEIMTQHVEAVMNGEAEADTLTTDETSYYEAAQRYLAAEEAGEKADSADYSQYVSRLVAMDRMIAEPATMMTPSFFETTESMGTKWASLEKMERQTVLKIIVGEADLDSFDEFVEQWKTAGGEQITEEVNEAIAK